MVRAASVVALKAKVGILADGTAVMMLLRWGVTTIELGAVLQTSVDVAANRVSVLVSFVMFHAGATSHVAVAVFAGSTVVISTGAT